MAKADAAPDESVSLELTPEEARHVRTEAGLSSDSCPVCRAIADALKAAGVRPE